MRKKIILIFSLSLLILLALIIGITHNWSPEQSFSRTNSKSIDNLKNLETLKKINLNKDKVMFVNKTPYNQLNLVITRNKFLKGWSVEDFLLGANIDQLDNYIFIQSNSNKYNFTSSWSRLTSSKDPDKKGILYGFFTGTNNNYKEIYVDDIKCNIEKIDDNLFLYYCFSGPPKFNYKVVE
ncbi:MULTISPECIES: hypothetical protein [Clostridium]|uniref:Lipoprotein n=1 Tax=Clostridium cibarium TaxID=2762247 RepID=A0ABR8PTW1_9CLOT|nr:MULTISPECIES: hypothetical protein [Clostridium]MBD7911587.1 hypothetical protein [Clostridium cibarium]